MTSIFKQKVVIIDGDAELRKVFTHLINASPKFFTVATYARCEDAIKKLYSDLPDLVLTEFTFEDGMNGIAAVKAIKEKLPRTDTIILSSLDDPELVFDAFKAGANGYLCKSSGYSDLLSSLDEISRGGAPMSSKISRMVVEHFHANKNSPLTKRETEILQLIFRGNTYSQIANELLISKETSKAHIRNIYTKLQAKSKSEALAKAVQEKYI